MKIYQKTITIKKSRGLLTSRFGHGKILLPLILLCILTGCARSKLDFAPQNAGTQPTLNHPAQKILSEGTVLLSQDFNSSSVLSDYYSTSPSVNQVDAIGTTGSGTTVAIDSSRLLFDRTGNANGGYYTRKTDLSPASNVVQVKFDILVSSNNTLVDNAATLQIGSGFSNGVVGSSGLKEANPYVHSRLGISVGSVPGRFALYRNDPSNARSTPYNGGNTITWVINNSGNTIVYSGPDGSNELLANDTWDAWIGNVRVFDDIGALTAGQTLSNFKFSFNSSAAKLSLDNIKITSPELIGIDGSLIIQSGFEGTTSVVSLAAQTDKLTGVDNTLSAPNDWDNLSSIGLCRINYQAGDTTDRYARIASDPENTGNKALHFWLAHGDEGASKGRIQVLASKCSNLREIYQSVKLYLPTEFNTLKNWNDSVSFFTIMEFWNNQSDTIYPFRLKVSIKKNATPGSNFYLRAWAQTYNAGANTFSKVWEKVGVDTIPIAKWMTLEYYIKEGDQNTGRFYLSMQPDGGTKKIIFNESGYTRHPDDPAPDGINYFNPLKLYTSEALTDYMTGQGKILNIYWDDLKIWRDKRP